MHPSLSFVLFLQSFSSLDRFWTLMTLCGDPHLVFLYIIPILYWITPITGLTILCTLVATDYVNALLKWPLAGDRPYWYHSDVREFWMTCESGYGMPSGHVMVTTSIIYMGLHLIRQHIGKRLPLWLVSLHVLGVIWIILIAISRVHVGAHFPGQVLAGAISGVIIAHLLIITNAISRLISAVRTLPTQTTLIRAFILTSIFILIPILEYIILLFTLDTHPLHSLYLSFRGCDYGRSANERTYHVYSSIPMYSPGPIMDTNQQTLADAKSDIQEGDVPVPEISSFQASSAPLVGIIRDSGVVMAIGLTFIYLHRAQRLTSSPRPITSWRTTLIDLGISFILYSLLFWLTKSFVSLFHDLMTQHHVFLYTLNAIEYTWLTIIFTIVVPHVTSMKSAS